MFQNLNFTTALHIMVLLELNPEKFEWMSSEYISGSVNVNQVTIRKLLKQLKTANLIDTKEGKSGGVKIRSTEITLQDIYVAVTKQSYKLNSPNALCLVGRQINAELYGLFNEVQLVSETFLKKKTLKAFSLNFKK